MRVTGKCNDKDVVNPVKDKNVIKQARDERISSDGKQKVEFPSIHSFHFSI